MDLRIDQPSETPHTNTHDLPPEEEQRFSEWIQKRQSLYEMMEQQVQSNIKTDYSFW